MSGCELGVGDNNGVISDVFDATKTTVVVKGIAEGIFGRCER